MSSSREEQCVTNSIEKTIRVDEDVDMKMDSLQSSYSLDAIKCMRCAEYLENGHRAWQMCSNYAEKLREIDSLRASLQQKEASLRECCEYIEVMQSSMEDTDRRMAVNVYTILQIRNDVAQKVMQIQHLSSKVSRIKADYKNMQANGVKSREEYEKRIRDLEANLTLMIGSNYRILTAKHQSDLEEKDSTIKLMKEEMLAFRRHAEQSDPVISEKPEELIGFIQKELEWREPILENVVPPSDSEKSHPIDEIMSTSCVPPDVHPLSNSFEQTPKSSVAEFSKKEEEVTAQKQKLAQRPKKSFAAERKDGEELAPARKKLRKTTAVLDSNSPVNLAGVKLNRTLGPSPRAARLAILKRAKSTTVRKLPDKKNL